MDVKEIIIYTVVALSSLFVLGYSVHMFLGGMVSQTTERNAIIIACSLGLIAMAYMVWDVLQRRRNRGKREGGRHE